MSCRGSLLSGIRCSLLDCLRSNVRRVAVPFAHGEGRREARRKFVCLKPVNPLPVLSTGASRSPSEAQSGPGFPSFARHARITRRVWCGLVWSGLACRFKFMVWGTCAVPHQTLILQSGTLCRRIRNTRNLRGALSAGAACSNSNLTKGQHRVQPSGRMPGQQMAGVSAPARKSSRPDHPRPDHPRPDHRRATGTHHGRCRRNRRPCMRSAMANSGVSMSAGPR